MTTTFKLSALALVMALTACGSSGGGDSVASKPVVENTSSSSQNQATINSNGAGNPAFQTGATTPVDEASGNASTETTASVNATKIYGGKHWTLANYKSISNRTLGTSAEDKLIVEGKEIELSIVNVKAETALKDSRFGYFGNYSGIANHNLTYYSQGVLTDVNSVPTSGKVSYKGPAHFGTEGGDRKIISSEFTVDFGAKTVNGKLSGAGINVTLPTATILGNAFEGVDNKSSVHGNFFGSQAAELGGVFSGDDENGKGMNASFGATKQ